MAQQTHSDWMHLAEAATFEGRAFIAGRYQPAADGKTFECISPIDGRVLTHVSQCGAEDVDLAVTVARSAFKEGRWSGLNPKDRKNILFRFAEAIKEDQKTLALLETLDMGKPINESMTIDLPRAIECVAWYAEAADKYVGEVLPADVQYLGLVTREPLGVVACIVPWNFPLVMAAWKIAPALAMGNSVILKPSEKSPLTAIRLAHLAQKAGIPDGVFSVLPGPAETGKMLGLHQEVDCVAFTGSTQVGKLMLQYAGQSNLKRVSLELGGKSPNIILPDCPDMQRAAEAAAQAIFFNAGQMCTAGSRLLVHRAIKDQIIDAVVGLASNYTPANPLNPATRMGAIVDRIQLERVLSYIKIGQEQARLLIGGKQICAESGGYFISPTIFDAVPQSRIAREEIFGPVLSVIEFDTLDEAIEIANETDYGLAAAVWTADLSRAHLAARRLRAGTVWVNGYNEGGDMNFPFGGYKQSGQGRDKSLHALEKYSELKSTVIRLS